MKTADLLLINMSKGWCIPLKGGSDGLLTAQMERLLLGDIHELLTIKQVNAFQSKRGKPDRCPVRLLTPSPQPKTRLPDLSLETFSKIMSHLSDAHIFGKLATLLALAMSCQAIYEKIRPLLCAALNAASRWEGDHVVILGPDSDFDLLPPRLRRWCVAPGFLFIVDDSPKRMEQAAHLLAAIRSNGLLSRKVVYRADMDIQVFVRGFLTSDTPYRLYAEAQFRATPPIDKRALAMVWLELVSAQQATFDHASGEERFLCNRATGQFLRQSAFHRGFLSRTRADTVSSSLQLGDIVPLLIASSARSKDLDFSSSSRIDLWDGPWAGDAFIFASKEAQIVGYEDVSDTITDFLLEVRASDIIPPHDNTGASDADSADEPECYDEGDLADQQSATFADLPIPVIRVTVLVGDA